MTHSLYDKLPAILLSSCAVLYLISGVSVFLLCLLIDAWVLSVFNFSQRSGVSSVMDLCCISLLTSDAEHFLLYLSAIPVASLVECAVCWSFAPWGFNKGP